jgi:hypothetical protein
MGCEQMFNMMINTIRRERIIFPEHRDYIDRLIRDFEFEKDILIKDCERLQRQYAQEIEEVNKENEGLVPLFGSD